MKAGKTRQLLGHLVFVMLLCTAGCGIQSEKRQHEELLGALSSGNAAELERLLAKGVDINAKGNTRAGSDTTVLHAAAMGGDTEIVQLLIEKGADVDARGKGEQTPLFAAALAGSRDVADALIAAGADVNARDHRQSTPLHSTVRVNNSVPYKITGDRVELARLLLSYGADVNAKDRGQYTPLHAAIAWGWNGFPQYETIVEVLLLRGAHPNARDGLGRTPLEMAEGNQAIIDLLVKYGARE